VLRRDLWEQFRGLADGGTTVVVSSHVMDEAARCDRLLLLRAGRLLADSTPEDLRAETGAGRYSLFTGDIGAALLAAACLDGADARFPGVDDW